VVSFSRSSVESEWDGLRTEGGGVGVGGWGVGGASDSIPRETVWIACESRCVCVCVEQSGVCLEALVVCIWKYIGGI